MFVEEFKPNIVFVEIDCFNMQSYKLAILITVENIKVSTVSKEPSIDFSLYDYVFEDCKEAEDFIEKVKRSQVFPVQRP
jgi:hypothetical protein